jgi:cytochrome bd ubiquinol oxidase subunit I
LILFSVVYTLLFICALFFGSKIIRKGPNLSLSLPKFKDQPAVDIEPAEFVPDQRPVEAQQ